MSEKKNQNPIPVDKSNSPRWGDITEEEMPEEHVKSVIVISKPAAVSPTAVKRQESKSPESVDSFGQESDSFDDLDEKYSNVLIVKLRNATFDQVKEALKAYSNPIFTIRPERYQDALTGTTFICLENGKAELELFDAQMKVLFTRDQILEQRACIKKKIEFAQQRARSSGMPVPADYDDKRDTPFEQPFSPVFADPPEPKGRNRDDFTSVFISGVSNTSKETQTYIENILIRI